MHAPTLSLRQSPAGHAVCACSNLLQSQRVDVCRKQTNMPQFFFFFQSSSLPDCTSNLQLLGMRTRCTRAKFKKPG